MNWMVFWKVFNELLHAGTYRSAKPLRNIEYLLKEWCWQLPSLHSISSWLWCCGMSSLWSISDKVMFRFFSIYEILRYSWTVLGCLQSYFCNNSFSLTDVQNWRPPTTTVATTTTTVTTTAPTTLSTTSVATSTTFTEITTAGGLQEYFSIFCAWNLFSCSIHGRTKWTNYWEITKPQTNLVLLFLMLLLKLFK